jgi:hypothetical protein
MTSHGGDPTGVVADDEISLFRVLDFMSENWKTIVGAGVIAMALQAGNLWLLGHKYEASFMVEMAQIRGRGGVPGSYVEAPALFVERLKSPTAYSPGAIEACADEADPQPAESVARLVRSVLPRGVPNVVEIRVQRPTPTLARQCASVLFDMIRGQQKSMAEAHEAEMRATLLGLQSRLKETRAFVLDEKSASLGTSLYLMKREELISLTHEIAEMERALGRESDARLISPVFASSRPASSGRLLSLFVAALAGCLAGMTVAPIRRTLAAWRASRV